MRFDLHSISQAGGQINEDGLGHRAHAAWLLDGATSISGRRLADETDASWFVRQVCEALSSAHPSAELRETLAAAVGRAQSLGTQLWADWGSGVDTPSASFAAAQLDANRLRLFNLGDCRILYQLDQQPMQSFGSCAVAELDAQLLQRYTELRQTAPTSTHRDLWQQLVPLIRANRRRMNRPDGYWVLSPDASSLAQLQEYVLSFDLEAHVVLATDGLYRWVDTYLIGTEQEFFSRAFEPGGLEQLLLQVREAERIDAEAKRFPRVKLKDDASAVAFHCRTS
ncbi:MAG TPA: hypothetical protein VNO84_09500 [Burkholderiaceae bacterium]|nr:hypothetical protein [Burkholderiaceae bacterium]